MKILAIDLSSYGQTSYCCSFDTDTRASTFQRVATTLEAIREWADKEAPAEIYFEACGVSHIMYHNLLDGPWTVTVISANEEPWRWRSVKKKTDRDDALKIAKLASVGDVVPVHLPGEKVRQWRQFIHYRQHLVQRRTKIRNQIRSILDREGIDWPKNWQGWTPDALARLQTIAHRDEGLPLSATWRFHLHMELQLHETIERSIKDVLSRLHAFAKADERVALLRTVPGVGPRLAEALVSYIDDPHRFRTGKQVANSVGLTPRILQSGDQEILTRISKRGNALVRTLLVEVVWLGRQFNPWLAETYDRIAGKSSSRRKIAAVACARKLLIRCWAMLRDGTPWDQNHHVGGQLAPPPVLPASGSTSLA